MALIKCSECGQEVSDKASNCPKCGCPINGETAQQQSSQTKKNLNPPKMSNLKKFVIVAIALGVVVIAQFYYEKNINKPSARQEVTEQTTPKQTKYSWTFEDDKKVWKLTVDTSDNTIVLEDNQGTVCYGNVASQSSNGYYLHISHDEDLIFYKDGKELEYLIQAAIDKDFEWFYVANVDLDSKNPKGRFKLTAVQ